MPEQEDTTPVAARDAGSGIPAPDSGSGGPTAAVEPGAPLDDVAAIVATLAAARTSEPATAATDATSGAHAGTPVQTPPEPAARPTVHAPVPPPPATVSDSPQVSDSQVSAPARTPAGVRRDAEPTPASARWNPGARYRSSRLAALRDAERAVAAARASRAEAGPVHLGPAPAVGQPEARLAGRLYRGPARRVRVFDRDIWTAAARSSRAPRDISEALTVAVERYRKGAINTTGLVRAIGHALAA